jgi:AAA-like domain
MSLGNPMIAMSKLPVKRKRGVLLSPKGWQRLQAAEQQLSQQEHTGKPYTLQELSERTGLSSNTLARVRGRKIAVDQQTLESYFRAFSLTLTPDDCTDSELGFSLGQRSVPPSGQIPLNSPFYVSRAPAETLCFEGLMQPGGLVRVKAPRQSGKTSLVARTLMQAREQQVATVILSLRLADSTTFRNLQRFLQWFCAVVTQSLDLPNQLEESWDNLFGASYNCTHYFEHYILKKIDGPLVLALDEADTLFEYPEVASDFFGMLRAWYEKARYGDGSSELWQKLRLVLVHANEVSVPLNISQSPFNAGLLVELPPFNQDQVQELAQRYGLEEPKDCATALTRLVGGSPFLSHLGCYYLSLPGLSLEQLVDESIASSGIYSSHLRHQLWELQKSPELLAAFKQVILSAESAELDPLLAVKLQSKGLVRMNNQQVSVSCDLYRQYFIQALGGGSWAA